MTASTGPRTEVVTLGEALVAFRAEGRLDLGGRLTASPAGAEMNVAIGLARLGHRSTWIGVLGTDPAGDLIARTLRAEGVDIGGTRRDDEAVTGVMLVDLPHLLPPVVTYHRRDSAGSRLSSAEVESAPSARIWHASGITPALSPAARAAVDTALLAARAAGALVSFDVNYRAKLWDRGAARAVLEPIARRADLVVASEDELELVSEGGDELAQVASLLDAGVREVVVKRGSRGAEHFDATGRTSCPALDVVEVNSIGAGDAFTAGYLSGLLDGLPVYDRLWRGAACGAFAVSGRGDWEQAPSRADLARVRSGVADAAR